jgi:hypothetical protein
MSIMQKPIQIFANILGEVASRAAELNDPQLNVLMCRLALYSMSDPESPDYDDARLKEILDKCAISAAT